MIIYFYVFGLGVLIGIYVRDAFKETRKAYFMEFKAGKFEFREVK